MGNLRPRRQAKEESDAGFTLVEVIAAMGIAAIVLTALLGATISAARASITARVDQQAGDLLVKTLEDLRSLDYGAVALTPAAVAADSSIVTPAENGACPAEADACWTVPNGIGLEPVVLASTGAVDPHISTVTANANNVAFTLRRYVTQPPGENTRRVTAIAEWSIGGTPYSREVSTMFANTRRGLPLPKFTVAEAGGGVTVVNPGGMLQVPVIVKNLGARDAFELRVLADDVFQPNWVIYPDETCSGGFDEENPPTALQATSGVYRTPEVFPDSITCYIATLQTSDAANVEDYSIVVQGQSTKQPSAETAIFATDLILVSVQDGVVAPPTPTPTISDTATPTPTPTPSTTQVCSTPAPAITPPNGYTVHRFVLQNDPAGDTETVDHNPMQRDDCGVQTDSFAYSTEESSEIGRSISVGGDTDDDGGPAVAEWRWLAPVITDVRGDAVVRFDYKCTSGTNTFEVALGDYNQTESSGQWTSRDATTVNVSCTGNWSTAEATLNFRPAFSLRSRSGSSAVPTYLSLRIAVPTGSTTRLNYDSPEAPSTLFVGIKP